jgi:uncharacterized protein YerC
MGKHTNLGPTEKAITDEQIASLYQEGLTYADIETVFGVSQQHTQHALKRQGVQPRKGGFSRKLVQCEIDRLLKMVGQGSTVKTIAYEFGINQTTVSSIVNQHGGRRFVLRQYKETDQ